MNIFNIAVLSSGMSRGSNLKAMANYFNDNKLPVQIVFVIRTKAEAPIKDICDELNITCHYIPYKERTLFEEKVIYLINYHNVHLLALAGFLKQLSPSFINESGVPILNIHPALLPKYGGKGMYGMAVHREVFNAKDKESGVTIHLVNPEYDQGDIIAQKKVDVSDCSNDIDVAHKVLKLEHQFYGQTIWQYLTKLYS